jgi:mediator of RNA polymerase II transcription subunit 5
MEQVMFIRLAKTVKEGIAFRSNTDAVNMIKVLIHWMRLFSDMSSAFAADVMGAVHGTNSKLEMECAKSAFVLLLSNACEDPSILTALRGASAKGIQRWNAVSLCT